MQNHAVDFQTSERSNEHDASPASAPPAGCSPCRGPAAVPGQNEELLTLEDLPDDSLRCILSFVLEKKPGEVRALSSESGCVHPPTPPGPSARGESPPLPLSVSLLSHPVKSIPNLTQPLKVEKVLSVPDTPGPQSEWSTGPGLTLMLVSAPVSRTCLCFPHYSSPTQFPTASLTILLST
jgi:hypothetical protein